MADDTTLPHAVDKSWISLHDKEGVTYWSTRFGINRATLESAIKIVGCSPDAVQALLRR